MHLCRQVLPLSWHQITNSVTAHQNCTTSEKTLNLFTLCKYKYYFMKNGETLNFKATCIYLWGSVFDAAESDSCNPQSSLFGGDQLRSKLPAATLKASWLSAAKLLLLLSSLTLKQGNDTNITQNAITPTSFFLRPNGVLKWMKGNVVWNQWGKHGPG